MAVDLPTCARCGRKVSEHTIPIGPVPTWVDRTRVYLIDADHPWPGVFCPDV